MAIKLVRYCVKNKKTEVFVKIVHFETSQANNRTDDYYEYL